MGFGRSRPCWSWGFHFDVKPLWPGGWIGAWLGVGWFWGLRAYLITALLVRECDRAGRRAQAVLLFGARSKPCSSGLTYLSPTRPYPVPVHQRQCPERDRPAPDHRLSNGGANRHALRTIRQGAVHDNDRGNRQTDQQWDRDRRLPRYVWSTRDRLRGCGDEAEPFGPQERCNDRRDRHHGKGGAERDSE